MDKMNGEIEALKNKLVQLENAKKDFNETKTDINKNFEILNQAIDSRRKKVDGNRYSKSCIVAKFIDRDMIDPLQAIYNILSIMNNRLNELEQKLSN